MQFVKAISEPSSQSQLSDIWEITKFPKFEMKYLGMKNLKFPKIEMKFEMKYQSLGKNPSLLLRQVFFSFIGGKENK